MENKQSNAPLMPLKIQPDGIPDLLKQVDRWVTWKAKPKSNGKFDKIPCHPVKGHNINGLDTQNWLTYEQALSAYRNKNLGGIGIVLSDKHTVTFDDAEYYLVALDFDNIADTKLDAKGIWMELGKPYMEVSPSGRGLRMFVLSSEPISGGNDNAGHEMYVSGRFMTVTGVEAKGRIRENTAGLKALDKRWFGQPEKDIDMFDDPHIWPYEPNIFPDELPETRENVALIIDLLDHISSDCDYDHWRNIIWSIQSTGWKYAEMLARIWSKKGEKDDDRKHEYEQGPFENVIASFVPGRGLTMGTLYHHAKNGGWIKPEVPPAASVEPPEGLVGSVANATTPDRLLTTEEVKNLPTSPYRVRGLLPAKGLAAIYGTPGSGKSFLVMDLIFAIAGDHPDWFGMRVKPAPVVYVALEGRGGIAKRIKAWEQHHKTDAPENARVLLREFHLLAPEPSARLATEVVETLGEGSVIVIDTLNQSAPGADENSSADMGEILSNAMLLAKQVKGLVILIHHSGKEKSRGLRGHSSLHAALDAAVEVNNAAAGRSWKIAKSKDDEGDISMDFELVPYVVDTDEDNLDVTSCAVERAFHIPTSQIKPPNGKNQTAAMSKLREMVETDPTGIDHKTAVAEVAAILTCDPGRRKTVAKDTVDGLIERGNLHWNDGKICIS